jgi:hypothetical protein
MRKTTSLMIAIALVASGPAFAQATNDTTTAGGNAVGTGTTPDGAATADPTMNGLTAGSAPATAEPGTIDTSYGDPGDGRAGDNDSFPWGLLGLLGLAGLIPRKRRDDRVVDRTDRTTR